MRLEIYEEEKSEENVLRLALRNYSDITSDRVVLEVVDENGDRKSGGRLLAITGRGKLRLYGGISKPFGLCLDENERLFPHNS